MKSNRVVVIGGGFSGLVTAYFLDQKGFQVELFEQSERFGGKLSTKKKDWGLVETAANGLICTAETTKLLDDLQVDWTTTLKSSRRRYIFRNGKGRRWPLGFAETWALAQKVMKMKWGRGSVRPLQEESISEWCRHHLTPAADRFLLEPALQGIYAGSTAKLHAGLVLGPLLTKRKDKKARHYKGTVAPVKGMGALIDALVRHLKAQGHQLHLQAELPAKLGNVPWVICTDMKSAVALLQKDFQVDIPEAAELEVLPVISVTLHYAKAQKKYPGFGCLFPRGEGVKSLGVLFNTYIFPERSSQYSETWILGGAAHPEMAGCTEEEILQTVMKDREVLYGASNLPEHFDMTVWQEAIPYYNLALHEMNRHLSLPRDVYLCGNYLGGIGLSKILTRAKDLSETIARDYGQ